MKRIVVAMAAHVDAGKTTLTEELLFQAGAIRKRGRVDNGDAFLDSDPIERRRGITIFSKQAVLKTGTAEFTLLDTPGHVDFSAEAERALSVPDCAVLLISGTDGIQSHTRTLWELLARFRVPVFIFVNKMDISHRSNNEIIAELRGLNSSILEFDGHFDENSAEYDEDCMNCLLETGSVPPEQAAKAIAGRRLFPVLFGSALRSDGADRLLSILEKYALPKDRREGFAALAYKITTDENGTRLTHLKINGGTLKNRSVIDDSDEKITQIRIYNGTKYTAVDQAQEGQLCAVAGLTHTRAGQTFGEQPPEAEPFIESYLNYKVDLPEGADVFQSFTKLKKLEEEDPQLKFSWSEQLKEIHVSVMGEIQLEVLQNVVEQRFGEKVTFSEGSIAYRETIEEKTIGMGHYEPLRHYAEVHLLIEPQPRGSGVTYDTQCTDLDENWQRLILSDLRSRRHIGVLTGSPLTDVKITLVAGRAHQKHTEGGDFRQAAWRAVRQGLAGVKSVLLEPVCKFTLPVPPSCVGRAMPDLQQ
ncbi:MAG: TetM/TetW/TetO/TetS family tetracycline resistance ribosomal protection protein, partial [Oscillospiraceae bacterium]|nr:TetM/TetW/TetO/TetS family tetracycline resistance ribosomal protection protein [Oscillospiraceae bacterium]